MSTELTQKRPQNNLTVLPPRLPYFPKIKDNFGIDADEWRALTDSVFPNAATPGAVILALSYCKARKLDPFKKMVHIVPIWDRDRRCEIETVWPGIAEYRTTAVRTGIYAGHDEVAHGPMIEHTWQDGDDSVTIIFPEWAQLTVYRLIGSDRYPFPGPKVYWLETYASKKNNAPNSMWRNRPIGMIDKCAEAAALRGAFPEELGGELTADEVRGFRWQGQSSADTPQIPNTKLEQLLDAEEESKNALPVMPIDEPATTEPPPPPPTEPYDPVLYRDWEELISNCDSMEQLAERELEWAKIENTILKNDIAKLINSKRASFEQPKRGGKQKTFA